MKINDLKEHIYSPYSDNKEDWCVVAGKSGTLYPGVRLENISFPLTITAMHGAICSCLGNGDRPEAIYSESEGELHSYWIEQFKLSRLAGFPDPEKLYNPFLAETGQEDEILKSLAESAVIPHSDFPVSALLHTDNGIVPGVNIEIDAWALGLCAERLAIFRAVTAGVGRFYRLQLYAPKGDFSSPCGACRQVLMEWMPDKNVELHHGDNTLSTHKIMHLLPYAFSSSNLVK